MRYRQLIDSNEFQSKILEIMMSEEKVNKYISQYVKALEGQEVSIKTNTLFIKAIK